MNITISRSKYFTQPGFLLLFSISVLSLLGVSCTVVPRRETRTIVPVYQRPVGNPNAQSIHYYMMGEAAIFQGSYAHAFQFLSQADVFDPENVTIKERILETLYILAEEDSLIYNRIIELVPGGLIDRMMPFDDYLKDEQVKALRAEAYHHAERLQI